MRALVRRVLAHPLIRSRLARDTGWSFLLKMAARGLGFGVGVLLARTLGAEGYGIYAFALAVVTLLALPAQVGLPTLVMRETARGLALGRPADIKGVWAWAGKVSAVLSLVLAGGAGAVLWFTSDGQLTDRGLTMIWAFALVPLVALGNLRGAALRGLNKIVAGQLPEFILRPGAHFVLLGVALFAVGSFTAAEAMALHVLAAALAFLGGAALLVRHTPRPVRRSVPVSQPGAWLASTLPLALIAGMATVNSQADILILALFESDDQVGIYRVAVQTATLASFGLQAVNMVVAPRFAALQVEGDRRRLQRLVRGSARVVLGFSLPVTLLFVVVGRPLLVFVFGPEFAGSYLPLVILLIGQTVNSAAGSVGTLLNMSGYERDSARATAAAVLLNVGLNFALVPLWGVAGAAVAGSAALSARNLWQWWAVRRRLGLSSLAFGANPTDDDATPPRRPG